MAIIISMNTKKNLNKMLTENNIYDKIRKEVKANESLP